jgi:hypothetical protein
MRSLPPGAEMGISATRDIDQGHALGTVELRSGIRSNSHQYAVTQCNGRGSQVLITQNPLNDGGFLLETLGNHTQ